MNKEPKLIGGHIVKIETAQLESFLDVSGAGDYRVVPFERDIFWVRSAVSRVMLAHKGKLIKEVATYIDGVNGFLACVKPALDCALMAAADLRLLPHTATENLAVQVLIKTQDTPAVMDKSPKAMEYMDLFKKIAIQELDGTGGEDNSIRIAYAGKNNALRDWIGVGSSSAPNDYDYMIRVYDQIPWLQKQEISDNEIIWSSDTSKENTPEKAMQRVNGIIAKTPNLIGILEEQRQKLLLKNIKSR